MNVTSEDVKDLILKSYGPTRLTFEHGDRILLEDGDNVLALEKIFIEGLDLIFGHNLHIGKEPPQPAVCVTIFDTLLGDHC